MLIYSRVAADGEFGLPSSNYTLAYACGNHPADAFTYGGTIIDARSRGVDDAGQDSGYSCRVWQHTWQHLHDERQMAGLLP